MFIVKVSANRMAVRFALSATSSSSRCLSTSTSLLSSAGERSSSSSSPSPSSKSPSSASPPPPPSSSSSPVVRKEVFISQSNDIFSNLALEDWLYKRGGDFSSRRLLFLYRDSPAVVIGRHQNPWIEADVEFCSEHRIPIARRNSGGGAVYHDIGNLNCSFFMPRHDYDRKSNLEMIRSAVWDTYGMDLVVNERDDVLWQGSKVSGSAAKLGREVAYHHCTLLVHSDRAFLHRALGNEISKAGYDSRATESVRAKTACIRDAEPLARVSDIISAIGRVFLNTPVVDKRGVVHETENGGYQMVNPSDYWFPGVGDIRRDLASWDWIYGKTPEFSVTRRYFLPSSSVSVPVRPGGASRAEISVTLRVQRGLVVDAEVAESAHGHSPSSPGLRRIDLNRISSLKGQRYSEHLLDETVGHAFDGPLQPSSLPFDDYFGGDHDGISPSSPSPRGRTGGVSCEFDSFSGRSDADHRLAPMGARERDYVTSILTCA